MGTQDWESTTIFETTARGTLRVTRTLPKGGSGPRLHYHAHTTERITVLIGALDLIRGDQRLRLTQGMGVVIPPGTPHRYEWTGAPPRLQMEYDPAGAMESFFRVLDRAQMRRRSELLAIARLTARGGDYIFAGPPQWLQTVVWRVMLFGLWLQPWRRRGL